MGDLDIDVIKSSILVSRMLSFAARSSYESSCPSVKGQWQILRKVQGFNSSSSTKRYNGIIIVIMQNKKWKYLPSYILTLPISGSAILRSVVSDIVLTSFSVE